ncbi:membrane dipeptidase [uncultured Cyclobacterium sp.]|uniref:dipeptidase n=1 Tax=uncultured Cyclobacterium sp. TaxID=453820 RepID=UPI0030EE86C1|tara:strand:- start:36280 stop:37620 length:1341 start_codon:yes stop_codon:yes gene_type:complete
MNHQRRKFLKVSGMAATSLGILEGFAVGQAGNFPNSAKQDPTHFQITPAMKEAYQVALKVLNPTKSQLERGLELHRNAVVIDCYGFMPRAAVDGERMKAAVEDSASPLELQDMQEDMTMTGFVEVQRETEEFINAWKASGVTCVIQNSGEEGSAIERLLKRLSRFTYATDWMKDTLIKAVTPEDILLAKKQNKHSLYFTGNGVPLPQDWISTADELRYIRVFYQLGIRMMHLTYNRRNMIGDGCGEPIDAGLSDFGRSVVEEMNRVGVIVDISHSGWQTSLDAAKHSAKPMVASHSTVNSLYEHFRAKPDNVIKAIADTDGYMGICCIPWYLGGSGDISSMMKHIDYMVKKFGSDRVAIGTDVAHNSQYASEENKKVPSYRKRRNRWEALWPEPKEVFTTTKEMTQSMAWTNWPLFTVGMVQMGYSDEDIQKILSGNVLRVARAAF